MLEPAPDLGQQNSKHARSPLVNEVNMDTDDDSAPCGSAAQVPGSDAVVPDSFVQAGDELDEDAQALLARTSYKKSQHVPVEVNLLSRDDTSPLNQSGFNFWHPAKKPVKQSVEYPPSNTTATFPPRTIAGNNASKQVMDNGNTELPHNPKTSRPEPKHGPKSAISEAALGEKQSTIFVSSSKSTEEDTLVPSRSVASPPCDPKNVAGMPKVPPFDAILGTNVETRVRGQKGKKTKRSRQGPESLPFENSHGMRGQSGSLQNEQPVLNVVPDQVPRDAPAEDLAPKAATTPYPETVIPSTRKRTGNDQDDQQPTTLKPPSTADAARILPEPNSPYHQTTHDSSSRKAPKERARNQERDSVLHRTSVVGGSGRVQKPQKKRASRAALRPADSNQAHVSGSLYPAGFELHMESIRVAFLAQKFQFDDTLVTERAHNESQNANQRNLISLQQNQIDLWKDRYHDLDLKFKAVCEKAKTNQKYVEGLRKDYDKLRLAALSHHTQNTSVLQLKIAEIENEKKELESDFIKTLDKMTGSQKSMRDTMNDCIGSLAISEAKRNHLEAELQKQTELYEEEKRKCNDMETRVFSTAQNMREEMESHNSDLASKLVEIQKKLGDTAAQDERDVCLEECVNALHELHATPFLTPKDIHQTEGILRNVHENIESKFGDLLKSVEGSRSLTEGITADFADQLQSLRQDLLKHEEAVSEKHRAYNSIENLKKELETNKKDSEKLVEKINALQQGNVDLKSNCSQFEEIIRGLEEQISEQTSSLVEQENKIADLHHQVEESKKELLHARSQLDEASRLGQEHKDAANKFENLAEQRKAKLLEIADEVRMLKTDNSTGTRAMIENECRRKFEEKLSHLRNENHRLKLDREAKDRSILDIRKELNATRDRVEGAEKNAHAADANVEALRKGKESVEMELKDALREIQEHSDGAAHAANLEQARQEKIRDLEGQLASLIQDKTDLNEDLKKARHNERFLQDNRKALLVEIETLKTQLPEINAAKTQISDLKRRLTQSDAALKESETRAKCLEIEATRNLEKCEKTVMRNSEPLRNEWLQNTFGHSGNQHAIQPTPTNPAQSGDRPGLSDRSYEEPSRHHDSQNEYNRNLQNTPPGTIPSARRDPTGNDADPTNSYATTAVPPGDPGEEGFFDAFIFDVINSNRDGLPDTQLFNMQPVSSPVPIASMSQQEEPPNTPRSSSSSLDDISSEALHELEVEQKFEGGLNLKSRVRFEDNIVRGTETYHVQETKNTGSQSRPRSQANMASRIAPSPTPPSLRNGESLGRADMSSMAESSMTAMRGSKIRSSDTSSPDYVHRQSQKPIPKMTYSHYKGSSALENSFAVPHIPERASTRKRKHTFVADESATSSEKRHRSSQSTHSSMPGSYSSYFAPSSNNATQSRKHYKPLNTASPKSNQSSSSTKTDRLSGQKRQSSKTTTTPRTHRSAMRSSQN